MMQQITIDKTELYNLIKLAVRDVLEEKLFRIRLEALPLVSDEEMRQIEGSYDAPPLRKDVGRTESLQT